ncbi:MAG: hypothetical protein NT145_03920 [Elusimicrobia bacterium]|nr:hypothetical protein [Elusimicrobiota bacterium]
MKTKKLFLLLAVFCFIPFLAYCEEGASGRLEDVVVKGNDTSKIDSEKTPIQINKDHMKVITPSLETEKLFLEKDTSGINKMKRTNPDVLSTEGTISPWLNTIAREPVTMFRLDIGQIKVKTWDLVVTDSRGYKFRMYSGKDTIPPIIKFSGRNEDGNFMRVGNVYGYILTYLDEADNKKTVIGKPFSVEAALHQEKEGLIISIDSKSLFDLRKDPLEITKPGKQILGEASDILKEYFNIPVAINVYAESESLARDQGSEIVKFVSKILVIPENKISVKGFRDIPENFHIDIVIINKKEASR